MFIRWSKTRVAEQHLEGECRDIEKLHLEIHAVEYGPGDQSSTRLLRVHHVESVSDGTLRAYVDLAKESES